MRWTTVMATGIVSLDLASAGWLGASRVIGLAAAAVWLLLALRAERPGDPAAVAATAVLGARMARVGWTAAAWAPLAAGVLLWAAQLPKLAGAPPRSGTAFLPAVATQSLAVLLATLAPGHGWAEAIAVTLLGIGLALYVHALARFDLRQLLRGGGDQWVAGGALAIAALACASVQPAAAATGVLRPASVVLWAAAMAWLPLLAAGELLHPRAGDPAHRWATVFPLGMYAAMSFAVGQRTGVGWIGAFARSWTWVAVAAWILIALMAARGPRRRAAA